MIKESIASFVNNLPARKWYLSVGEARSKDLIEWDYYPRNPALPGLGTSGKFDQNWVGWPRTKLDTFLYCIRKHSTINWISPNPIGKLSTYLIDKGRHKNL